MRTLGLLFVFAPIAGFTGFMASGILSWVEGISSGALYLAMAAAYVQSYPAFQADIPTFKILLLINEEAGKALSTEKILSKLALGNLFGDKLDDLIQEGLVAEKEGKLFLGQGGVLLVRIFSRYRQILGLQTGTG